MLRVFTSGLLGCLSPGIILYYPRYVFRRMLMKFMPHCLSRVVINIRGTILASVTGMLSGVRAPLDRVSAQNSFTL